MDVEKIARAIQNVGHGTFNTGTDGRPDVWTIEINDAARAAIRAVLEELREPTPEMLRDGAARARDFMSEKGPYPRTRAVYRAMIEQAMKEVE